MSFINNFKGLYNSFFSTRTISESQPNQAAPLEELIPRVAEIRGQALAPQSPLEIDTLPYCFVTLLPMSLIARIFRSVYREPSPLFQVSKAWAALKTNPQLYDELYSRISPHIFNKYRIHQTWGDPGPEPRLPLSWLVDFDPQEGAITFIPEKIIRNGSREVEYLRLKTLEGWSKNPTQGHPFKFSEHGWKELFEEPRLVEAPHWAWIRREAIGKGNNTDGHIHGYGKDYANQQQLARMHGGEVAGLIDLSVSIISKFITTGDRFFMCDPDLDDIGMSIRVDDRMRNNHIGIIYNKGVLLFVDCEGINSSILIAKKSFGVDATGKPIQPSASMHPELDVLRVNELKALLKQARSDARAASENLTHLIKDPNSFNEAFATKEQLEKKVTALTDTLERKIPQLGLEIKEARKHFEEVCDFNTNNADRWLEYNRARERLENLIVELTTIQPLHIMQKPFLRKFDSLMSLYNNEEIDNCIEIMEAITTLGAICAEARAEGRTPIEIFADIAQGCENNLESFLYNYIADEIDLGNYRRANEYIALFIDGVNRRKWFDLLRVRSSGKFNPQEAKALLSRLITSEETPPSLEFYFDALPSMILLNDSKTSLNMVKGILPLLKTEEDLEDLIEDLATLYRKKGKPKVALHFLKIKRERNWNAPEKPLDKSDPTLIKVHEILDMLS